MRLRHVLLCLVVIAALATTGCPNPGIAENTISFTLDDVDYSYSASSGLSTHAWGRGIVFGSEPPAEYLLTASATAEDEIAGTNSFEISIASEGDYWIQAVVYDAAGTEIWFELGSCDRTLLENTIRNIDDVGEQMQGVFWGPYEYVNGSTHILENVVFSVERLPDYWPPQ